MVVEENNWDDDNDNEAAAAADPAPKNEGDGTNRKFECEAVVVEEEEEDNTERLAALKAVADFDVATKEANNEVIFLANFMTFVFGFTISVVVFVFRSFSLYPFSLSCCRQVMLFFLFY